MLFSALGAVVVLATSTLGSPLEARTSCSLAGFSVPLPSGQTQVVAPAGVPVTGLVLGAGVQNYTCSDSGSYTYVISIQNRGCISSRLTNPTGVLVPSQSSSMFPASLKTRAHWRIFQNKHSQLGRTLPQVSPSSRLNPFFRAFPSVIVLGNITSSRMMLVGSPPSGIIRPLGPPKET